MSKFDKLVSDGIKAERNLRALNGSFRLSAKGHLAAALKNAQTTSERLDELQKKLEAKRDSMPESWRFLRLVIQNIKQGRIPTALRPGRMNWLGRESASGELGAIGFTPLEVYALGVRMAAAKHPDAFGQVDDLDAQERRRHTAQEKRDELFQQIETAWSGDDVLITEPGSTVQRDQGLRFVTFKCSGGAIAVGPRAGERLVGHLLNQPERKVAA